MSDETELNDSNGIANLRKQYEETQKALKEAQSELGQYRAEKRKASVAEVLKAKGLPERAASLYSGEDTSEDAVGKWVEEYADVFGVKQEEDPNAQAAERLAAASTGNSASIQNAGKQVLGDPEAILHAIQTLPYDELVKLGYMPERTRAL